MLPPVAAQRSALDRGKIEEVPRADVYMEYTFRT
jgi:hypothetical protein